MKVRGSKRIMMAAALAVATAVSGMAGQAQAFTFVNQDLVLAIYGNNTEALVNLGNMNTVLAPGGAGITNLNVSAELAAASVGTNPVYYTVFAHDFTSGGNGTLIASTAANLATIRTDQIGLGFQMNQSIGMSFLPVFDSTNLVPKADQQSFASNINQSGDGSMAGSWPVAMQGSAGQVLNVLFGTVDTNTFTQVGRVLLTAGGLLTMGNPGPSAVPLPAGVVLFGTGLAALVGIARRSLSGQAAA